MSKHTQQLFKQPNDNPRPTLAQTGKDGAPSLKELAGQLWDGMKPMFDHGRTETAAALFSGHAHVMYMKGQAGLEHGQDQVSDLAKASPDIEREGREI